MPNENDLACQILNVSANFTFDSIFIVKNKMKSENVKLRLKLFNFERLHKVKELAGTEHRIAIKESAKFYATS